MVTELPSCITDAVDFLHSDSFVAHPIIAIAVCRQDANSDDPQGSGGREEYRTPGLGVVAVLVADVAQWQKSCAAGKPQR
ncbi:MAG: hypothetical protein AAF827_09745 [Cyanobacteria bacterium P01_D01_bin.6]